MPSGNVLNIATVHMIVKMNMVCSSNNKGVFVSALSKCPSSHPGTACVSVVCAPETICCKHLTEERRPVDVWPAVQQRHLVVHRDVIRGVELAEAAQEAGRHRLHGQRRRSCGVELDLQQFAPAARRFRETASAVKLVREAAHAGVKLRVGDARGGARGAGARDGGDVTSLAAGTADEV